MAKPTITAEHLQRLLAERHAKDVWVAECKNGPTWNGPHLRLDGWAMARSWSPWRTYGYEIKVSRSDFNQDQKWPGYLPLCHEFYFVCPGGLIKADDLPQGVGLIWASQNGERLHSKVKSVRRDPEPAALIDLMAYVLMSRTRIVDDWMQVHREEPKDRLTQIREALAHADERKELAYVVHEHITRRFHEQEQRLKEMRELVDRAEALREHMAKLGISWKPDERYQDWDVRRELDALAGRLPADLHRRAAGLAKELGEMAAEVEAIEKRRPAEAA